MSFPLQPLPAEPGYQIAGAFGGDFCDQQVEPHYGLSRAAIQQRPAGRRRPARNWPAVAKSMQHGFSQGWNDAPCQHRGQPREVQSRAGHDRGANGIGFDGRPGGGMLEIGVRDAPYSSRLSGRAAKFAWEMMGPKRGDTAVELGGQRYFQFGRLAAL